MSESMENSQVGNAQGVGKAIMALSPLYERSLLPFPFVLPDEGNFGVASGNDALFKATAKEDDGSTTVKLCFSASQMRATAVLLTVADPLIQQLTAQSLELADIANAEGDGNGNA